MLVQQLVEHGVDRIYSLNGGHIAPIYDACLDVDIDIVDVRHEDAAVHMAHAYARLTGRPGVACLTAGPGVTNGVSAMAAAWSAASPVVVIAGKVPTPQIDMGALQDVDQLALVGAVSKTARSVRTTDQIGEAVSEAFSVAVEPLQGPTFLELPIDVLRSEAGRLGGTVQTTLDAGPGLAGTNLPEHSVSAAVDLLKSAERPVLIAGSGVLWSNAERSVRALAERLAMPVVTTSLARGILPINHPLNLFAARSRVLDAADVLLIVGTRFNYILNYGRPPRISATAAVIRIDASPSEIVRNRIADIAIVADAEAALGAILDQIRGSVQDRAWLASVRASHITARQAAEHVGIGRSIHPLTLCRTVMRLAPSNTRFVVDGGDILSFARLAINPSAPRHFFDPGPYGGLGMGIPFANAIAGVARDEAVVCITGDGALGFNVMELETAMRKHLPINVIVSNNAAWGIERNAQIMDYGPDRTVATELSDCRFDELARSLGAVGERVTRIEELEPAIRRALASDLPAVVDVVTDVSAKSPDLTRGLAGVPDDSPLRWATTKGTP